MESTIRFAFKSRPIAEPRARRALAAQRLFHPGHRHPKAGAEQPRRPAAGPKARLRIERDGVERHRPAKARAPGRAGALLDGGEQRAPDALPLGGGVHEQRAQRAGGDVELRDGDELAPRSRRPASGRGPPRRRTGSRHSRDRPPAAERGRSGHGTRARSRPRSAEGSRTRPRSEPPAPTGSARPPELAACASCAKSVTRAGYFEQPIGL